MNDDFICLCGGIVFSGRHSVSFSLLVGPDIVLPFLMSGHRPSAWRIFAQAFLRHPRDISSIVPTRAAVAHRIIARIRKRRPQVIVEYGPATGSLSEAMLRGGKLARGSALLLIEKSPEFIPYLTHTMHDPRVRIFRRSAEDVLEILHECGLPKADYIFSGIPLSTMPCSVADRILRNTYDALGKDGVFVQYAFRPHAEVLLRKYFNNVTKTIELFNIPPLMVFEARKH